MSSHDHSFVVPAYGDSPHLEACLRSLAAQEEASPVIIATPTPSEEMSRLARRYGATLEINPERNGIGADWNFALASASTAWVTIAHQDDIYLPGFSAATMQAADSDPDAVLVFTGYEELVDGTARRDTMLLRIKKVLLELGFAGVNRAHSRFFKTNTLRFGCAIPCPAVTLNVVKRPSAFARI